MPGRPGPIGDSYKVCATPQLKSSVIVIVAAAFALSLSLASTWHCEFMIIDFGSDGDSELGKFVGKWGWGLVTVAGGEQCYAWQGYGPDFFWDTAYFAGVAFGVLGNIANLFAFGISCVLLCVHPNKCGGYLLSSIFLLAAFCHCLSYIVFASNLCKKYPCTFATAAGLGIGAIAMQLITVILILRIPPPEERPQPTPSPGTAIGPPGTVKTTEIIEADGTRKIHKETVNADGSITVEDSIVTSAPAAAVDEETTK